VRDAGAQIAVRVQARARRDEIVGERDGVLVVRIAAPPVDGRANRALCKLIARRAGVAPSKVAVVRGDGSRDKLVRVEGLDVAALRAALLPGWS
jgi:uncharacterized protein (TIGR00251 family)